MGGLVFIARGREHNKHQQIDGGAHDLIRIGVRISSRKLGSGEAGAWLRGFPSIGRASFITPQKG